jgi:hypothetical protein
MMDGARQYSDEEDAVLVAAWARGDSVEEIASALGRSRSSVQTRASNVGLKSPTWIMASLPDRLSERLEEGWRPSRIARQYGLRVEVVERHAVIERRALEATDASATTRGTGDQRYRRTPSEMRDKIRDRHDRGDDERSIARSLRVSVHLVRRVVGELGDDVDVRRVA